MHERYYSQTKKHSERRTKSIRGTREEEIMKFYKVTCISDTDLYSPWFSSDRPFKAFGNRIFLAPDESRGALNRDAGETRFRFLVAVANPCHNLADLEACVLETCREWEVEGAVRIHSIESSTYRECFDGGYYGINSLVRSFSQALGANEFCTLLHEVGCVGEKIVEQTPCRQTPRTRYDRCLSEEIERMSSSRLARDGRGCKGTAGGADAASRESQARQIDRAAGPATSFLPAHYLFEGMNAHEYEPALDILLSSLVEEGRLPSACAITFDLDKVQDRGKLRSSDEYFLSCMNDALVESLAGMALVIRYGTFDGDGAFADYPYQLLTRLLDALARHPHMVQVVMVIPEGVDALKRRIQSRFAVPWVELRRDITPSIRDMDAGAVCAALERRARNEGLAPDVQLSTMVSERLEDRSFFDLEALYEEWRRVKLTREQFPSYLPVVQRSHARLQTKSENALERLNALIGLKTVKQHIADILARIQMNRALSQAGLPARPFSMHLAFLGEPGTGKTEVARLYADILREQHVLSEGRLVVRSGSALFDVDEAFKAARGSVLFIDEAYGLIGCSGAVTSLIAHMENYRDEVVVILAGYEADMERLFLSNPGFRSRIGFHLHFPSYSNAEKLEIFQLMAHQVQLTVPLETLARVRDLLARGGKRNDEGNARFVRKLFEDACGRQQARLARNTPAEGYTEEVLGLLLPDDVGSVAAQTAKSAREELDELIGLGSVKELVAGRIALMKAQKGRRDAGIDAPFIPLHLAFKGSPGTGKTEVARLLGRILKEEGVLSVGDFYECGRQDLVAGYVGGTAPKVEALFQRAKGSVIFIDEAYALNDGQRGGYGEEAITALIDQMEKLREDVVVIFAGYTHEIDKLFATNPGFASRVRTHIEFPDYNVDELVDILQLMAKKQRFTLAEGACEHVRRLFIREAAHPNFGNARFVRNLLEEALIAQGTRLASEAAENGVTVGDLSLERLTTLTSEDFSWSRDDRGGTPRAIGFLAA